MLEEIRRGKAWNVDLVAGRLTIGKQAYRTNLLGTFASGDGTFLWGWENPSAPDWARSLGTLAPLRALARSPGFPLLGQRLVSSDEADVNELALVCGELAGGHPLFVGVHDAGAALLLITDLDLDPAKIPTAYIAGVFLDAINMTRVPIRPCIERFLQRATYRLEANAAGFVARRAADAITVEFDDLGRLTNVSAALRPG